MRKNLFRLIASFALIALLYLSWLFPLTRPFWNTLDAASFHFLRSSLLEPGFSRDFWAIMNHKYADWALDIIMLVFVLSYIYKEKERRIERSFEMVTMILFVALVILSVNRYLLTEILRLRRLSPSVALDDGFRLSHFVTWLKIKETHHACFPSDHATTNFFFLTVMLRFHSKRWILAACLVTLLFTLPRMVLGAHWLTDTIIGSLSIVLLSTSLFLDTGLFDRIKNLIFTRKGMTHE